MQKRVKNLTEELLMGGCVSGINSESFIFHTYVLTSFFCHFTVCHKEGGMTTTNYWQQNLQKKNQNYKILCK